jgi:23S rRNA pseudouridine1911/1915/1917 synthase
MPPLVRVADAAAAGQRVDRFLADLAPDLTRSRIKALIEDGWLSRDGRHIRQPAEPVRPGATYTLSFPPLADAVPLGQDIALAILFEDADLIVLDKPPGLVVHPAPGNPDGTLVNALIAHCGDSLPGIGGERRPGIVHRLDKDTSGVMVVAKSELALVALSAAFASRDLDRAYVALVWGVPSPATGALDGAIGRDPNERKRMAVVRHGGKPALTRYRLLAHRDLAISLLECRLATGRTHQIRVHLATAGHPVVGDPVYLRRIPAAARALPEAARRVALDFPRQALHAARLGFAHPRTGAPLCFATAPPPDMATLLDALGVPMNPDLGNADPGHSNPGHADHGHHDHGNPDPRGLLS